MASDKKLFGKNNPVIPQDIFNYILGMLTLQDRVRSRLVNRAWNKDITRSPLWKQAGRGGSHDIVDFTKRYKLLHPNLKKLMKWGGCELDAAEHITEVWQKNVNYFHHLPQAMRDKLLDPNYPHQNLATNYMAFAVFRSGLIDVDEARAVPSDILHYFLSAYNFAVDNYYSTTYNGIYALSRKLITMPQAALISVEKLKIILNENGIEALENGRIKITDVPGASAQCLRLFLGDVVYNVGVYHHQGASENMDLIKEGIIRFRDAAQLSDDSLQHVLTPIGHQMLRENLVTIDQLKALPNSRYVQALLSNWGKFALSNALVSAEEIGQLANEDYASAVLSEWACIALRDQYVSLDQIKAMPNAQYAAVLLRRFGVEALKVGFITPEQIQAVADVRYASALLSAWGFEAMSEGLISYEMLSEIPNPEYLEKMMSENGLKALRNGLINIDILSDEGIDTNTLGYLLGDGYEAMEKGIVKVEEVIHRDENSVRLQAQHVKTAIENLGNYQAMLAGLSAKKFSSKNKNLGLKKAELLNQYFPNKSNQITADQLKTILEDESDPLLVNRSKFHFKFFKIKSAVKGYRNPLQKNRLCQSETEVRLVELYKACAAA